MSIAYLGRGRRWTNAYWASAVIHLAAVAFDSALLRLLSKATLMPALASWVRSCEGPPLLVAALLASALGDLLMEFDFLVPGMAMYAAAHACYVTLFRHGAQRRSWQVLAAYGVVYLASMVALWPGLGIYRGPVTAYAIMLTATAVTSWWYGGRAGLGGALFLASDALIGAGLAGHDFPLRDLLLKTAYGAGQYQIALGVLSAGSLESQSGGSTGRPSAPVVTSSS